MIYHIRVMILNLSKKYSNSQFSQNLVALKGTDVYYFLVHCCWCDRVILGIWTFLRAKKTKINSYSNFRSCELVM